MPWRRDDTDRVYFCLSLILVVGAALWRIWSMLSGPSHIDGL